MCSLGIEPTTFHSADAMFYHWATQEHVVFTSRVIWFMCGHTKKSINNSIKQLITETIRSKLIYHSGFKKA